MSCLFEYLPCRVSGSRDVFRMASSSLTQVGGGGELLQRTMSPGIYLPAECFFCPWISLLLVSVLSELVQFCIRKDETTIDFLARPVGRVLYIGSRD